ncbi:putative secreted RxLR effector protein [Phytophthora cinnamomi]|uniref:putative secreted RxLR effector protein n=1 Tax=Phytophthora cinnamomi TaxID=4785 RepID=UPI002A24FC6E|nr:putative secreted RxLR effector protein [Phytophthora cinnamomi]KAJ8515385.1 hypothetical protein ON010_g18568 [Phytophthora cinnamomi]QVE55566.1 RxLR effector protein 67 [Phytophthora cinnamomi]
MRASVVFVLLALLVCCNGIASAERAVKVSTTHTDSIKTRIGSRRRNLRGAAVEDEERALETLAERVTSMFKRNPSLSRQVENVQKNPAIVKSLEKATLTEKSSSKLRAYFARLSANSSKVQKFFIFATILLFATGVVVTWT